MNSRGMVGRIYKEDHYTLLQTKYESSGPCGLGDFFMFVPLIVSLWELMAIFDLRVMIHRIYVKLQIKMLHTKYRSFGSCGFREDFSCITHYTPMADNDASGARPV